MYYKKFSLIIYGFPCHIFLFGKFMLQLLRSKILIALNQRLAICFLVLFFGLFFLNRSIAQLAKHHILLAICFTVPVFYRSTLHVRDPGRLHAPPCLAGSAAIKPIYAGLYVSRKQWHRGLRFECHHPTSPRS